MIELDTTLKQFYSSFLSQLKILTDEKCPGKTWVENDHRCFCEFEEMCMNFMSPCECILQWSWFSDKQRLDLQKLYEMLIAYNGNDKTDDEICNDPAWHTIRMFAKKVYDDLKHVKYVQNK